MAPVPVNLPPPLKLAPGPVLLNLAGANYIRGRYVAGWSFLLPPPGNTLHVGGNTTMGGTDSTHGHVSGMV